MHLAFMQFILLLPASAAQAKLFEQLSHFVYITSPMWFRLRMKGICLLVGWLVLAPSAHAASVEGEIALPYSISNTAGAAVIKRFGNVVKASCSCRVAEFFGW
ncbi:MAG: hypothetical protein NTW03_12255 [Verrucomicrobia bacterium]|nr:hypothetical protein [Verrucomicrobiota bacterium]